MKKFWVTVNSAKHPMPNPIYVAVYGDIQDALAYAHDYMLPSFGTYDVIICDKNMREIYRKRW